MITCYSVGLYIPYIDPMSMTVFTWIGEWIVVTFCRRTTNDDIYIAESPISTICLPLPKGKFNWLPPRIYIYIYISQSQIHKWWICWVLGNDMGITVKYDLTGFCCLFCNMLFVFWTQGFKMDTNWFLRFQRKTTKITHRFPCISPYNLDPKKQPEVSFSQV